MKNARGQRDAMTRSSKLVPPVGGPTTMKCSMPKCASACSSVLVTSSRVDSRSRVSTNPKASRECSDHVSDAILPTQLDWKIGWDVSRLISGTRYFRLQSYRHL